jgi:hypothetical protein
MISNFIVGRARSLLEPEQIQEVGIGGFSLFARVSDSSKYTAQVPVNVLEDGSVASDNISNQPVTLSISGEISDIFIKPQNADLFSPPQLTKAGEVIAFLPSRTQSQISRIRAIGQDVADRLRQIDDYLSAGGKALDALSPNEKNKMLREQFVDFIESVYYGKQLISIDMPYRTHENMALTQITIERNNEAKSLRFEVTAQKVTFAEMRYTDIQKLYRNASSAASGKVSSAANKGAQDLNDVVGKKEKSLLSILSGG